MRIALPVSALLISAASHAVTRDLPEAMVNDILLRIKLNECPKAVSVLKDGMAKGFHQVTILGATMHEEGLCVRKDWDKAVELYLMARQQGNSQAALRMIAGYAAPAQGPDTPSALWWGQAVSIAPAQCLVPKEDHGDVDRYVKALATWPATRLAQCNYAVGVTAALAGELEYPALASAHHLTGKLTIVFTPAVPAFKVDTTEIGTYAAYGLVDGDMLRDQKSSFARNAFQRAVIEHGNKVLKRYPKPAQVDPDMFTQLQFVFRVE